VRERIKAFIDDALARMPAPLTTTLDQAEVLRRLQAAVDSEWTFGGSKGVVGRVDAYGFRLRVRIFYRNSFQTVMTGTMKAEGRGTRIDAYTGMNPFAAVFMTVWLSLVGLAAVGSIWSAIGAAPGEPVQAMFLLVPLGMFVFGIALVSIGRWFAREERARLITFLERTVDGKRAV